MRRVERPRLIPAQPQAQERYRTRPPLRIRSPRRIDHRPPHQGLPRYHAKSPTPPRQHRHRHRYRLLAQIGHLSQRAIPRRPKFHEQPISLLPLTQSLSPHRSHRPVQFRSLMRARFTHLHQRRLTPHDQPPFHHRTTTPSVQTAIPRFVADL